MVKLLKNKIMLIVTCAIVAILTAGLIVGNVICGLNFNIITQYMCGFGLNEDSSEAVGAREYGQNFAVNVEEDGAVLLKNDNGPDGKPVLPLDTPTAENPTKVNVFGWAGCDSGFIPQGTGSGTGSRNNLVTFLGGLKEAGFSVNEQLAADYEALGYSRVAGGNYVIEATTDELYKNYYGVVEAPESFYNAERMNSAKEFSDTAIIVIGRLMGEGNDYSKKQYLKEGENNESRRLLAISEREEYMIKQVTENFEKVVLVLNVANPMELGFVDEYDIDSVVYMGYPGTRGTIGLANLLAGKKNFSGKLADTYAYDQSTAASYATSGREGVGSYTDIQNGDTSLASRQNKYSDYSEDIYIGYKWYETAYADGFWESAFAKDRWGIENGYEDVVQYPFGYGLSYTAFEWTVLDCNYSDGDTLDKDGTIEFTLSVKNNGDYPGRDVVQLYYSAPYTEGGIEKSAIVLGAFEKNAVDLDPGETKEVKISMPVERMKSYDCYDKNNNGFMGYELEGGTYTLSFRTDVHTLAQTTNGKNTFTFKVPDGGYKYEIDSVTENKVENRFTTYTNPTTGASSTIDEKAAKKAHSIDGSEEPVKINYMTRADFEGTFPQDKGANRSAGSLINDTLYVQVNPNNDPSDEVPELGYGNKDFSWTVMDVLGLDYGDPMWDELISQMTLEKQARLITQGGFGTIAIDEIGMPKTVAADGPSGFNNSVTGQGDLKAVNYPCSTVLACTWDYMTAYEVGVAIGTEAAALGISGWYGPGANLHRSPMGGRNFEYYSEDPLLSGVICAYHVMGAKSKGLTAYIKHIAVNDSESGRNGAYKWLTEQNLRENYLVPFELAVKIGGANAMMSSVDRIGSTRVSGSSALLTSVLRDEWGFEGSVITDYYQNSGASRATDMVHDVDECVRAGNDQLLWTDASISWFNDSTSNTAKKYITQSAKNIVYTYVDTLNFSMTSQGLSRDDVTLTSVDVFPWWVILLVGIDVTAAALMAFWIIMMVRSYRKAAKRMAEKTLG